MGNMSFIHYVTKVLVDIMFFGGILACIALPFIMPLFTFAFGYSPTFGVNSLTLTLITSGICAVYILYQLKSMLKTLISGEPFVHKNVSCLRKCGVASLLIALIYLVRIIGAFTVGSAIIAITFALAGLFSLTLKDVFKQAVFYKEENDWTV